MRSTKFISRWVVLVAVGLAVGCGLWESSPKPPAKAKPISHEGLDFHNYEADPEFQPKVVIASAFEPITDATIAAASEAPQWLREDDLVLGISIDGEHRAYPINMITGPRREIINDHLGGRDIAATW